MAPRSYLIGILVTLLSFSALADSPWLPSSGIYNFAMSYGASTSYSNFTRHNAKIYFYLQSQINKYAHLRAEILDNNAIEKYRRIRMAELYLKKIDSLKKTQEKYKGHFPLSNFNIFLERGISDQYSFGIKASSGKQKSFEQEGAGYDKALFFVKKKLYENKKLYVSGVVGGEFANFKIPYLSLFAGVNFGKVKKMRNGNKIISELIVKNNLEKKVNFSGEFRNSLEFKSGLILQLSTLNSYNGNYNLSERYYYKDQFTVAKKIRNDILTFPEGTIFNLGIYQEYFGNYRKPLGKGVMGGFWLQI